MSWNTSLNLHNSTVDTVQSFDTITNQILTLQSNVNQKADKTGIDIIRASGFIKTNGSSLQYLMADGSVSYGSGSGSGGSSVDSSTIASIDNRISTLELQTQNVDSIFNLSTFTGDVIANRYVKSGGGNVNEVLLSNGSVDTTVINNAISALGRTLGMNYTSGKTTFDQSIDMQGNKIIYTSTATSNNDLVNKYFVDNSLLNYLKTVDANTNYLKIVDFNTNITNYVLVSSLNTTLNNYALSSTLNNYVLSSALNTLLNSYVLSSSLNTTLNSYALSSTLSNYALSSTLNNYVLSSTLNNLTVPTLTTTNNYIKINRMNIGYSNSNTNNMYIGDYAGGTNPWGTITGSNNLLFGASSGNAISSGSRNISIGSLSSLMLSTCNDNITIGNQC